MPKKSRFWQKAIIIFLSLSFLLILVSASVLTAVPARNFLQKRGSQAIGRELVINDINIGWNWSRPRVQMQGIRIANGEGFEEPYMLKIENMDFRIHIWKFLMGNVELDYLHITHPHLTLEKNDRNKNWDFLLFSKESVAVEAITPDNRRDFPVIGNFMITEGIVIYRDRSKDLDVELRLNTAQGVSNENWPMHITGKGVLQKQSFTLEAKGGSLEMLRNTGEDFPIHLDMKMGATQVNLEGAFQDPVRLGGVQASLSLKGSNMADLFYLTAIPLPPTPPYALAGTLGKKDKIWSFTGFKGVVGDSDLEGNLSYDRSGERAFLKAELHSQQMDVDDLGGFIGMAPSTGRGETAAPEQKQQAAQEAASSRLIPDTPLNVKRLRASDMDVTVYVKKLEAPQVPFKGGNVRFLLREGLLRLDPLYLVLANGVTEGTVVVDGRKDIPHVELDMNFNRLELSRFLKGTRFEEESGGHFGGYISLTGDGFSLADVLAGANGRAVFMMDGGQISLLLMEASDIDIAEAVPLLLGEDKTTRIRCGVTDFRVENGILYSQVIVFDTTDTNLQGKVDINLKAETIDAVLDARPKDPSLLSLQAPITVSGRLKHPQVMLQPVETGLRVAGAAVLGVVLTPLAAIIPFLEPGLGEDSPCHEILQQAQQ